MIEITAKGVKNYGPSYGVNTGRGDSGGGNPWSSTSRGGDTKKGLAGITKRKQKPVS